MATWKVDMVGTLEPFVANLFGREGKSLASKPLVVVTVVLAGSNLVFLKE
jgi:hypothetical protein